MTSLLLRIRLKSLFSSMFGKFSVTSRGSKGKLILIGFAMLYAVAAMAFTVGMMFYTLAEPLGQMGMGWMYFALASVMATLINFVGSVFITQSQLFTAKDNELLLSMPIRPGQILFSRMATLLALNYIYTLLIMLPAIIVYQWKVGFSAVGLVFAIISTAALPLISMALSCVCGWAIGLITSRMRKNNLLTFALFAAFFGAYMYFAFNLQNYMAQLIAMGEEIARAVGRAFPPMYWFGMATQGSALYLLLFLLACFVPFGLVYFIISKSYISILTTQKGVARIKYKARAMKAASPFSALLRREMARFFGTPIYLLNCGIGAVMHVIFGVLILFRGAGTLELMFQMSGELPSGLIPAMLCLMLGFCSTMIIPSAASVSLEGKNLWITRSAPLRTGQVLEAKLLVGIICGVPTGLIASLAAVYAIPMSGAYAAAVIIAPAALTVFASLFGLVCNLLMPRLDWISEAVVVKQSGSVMASVFGGMALLALPILLYLFAGQRFMSLDVFVLIFLVIIVLACFIMYRWIKTSGVKRFEKL